MAHLKKNSSLFLSGLGNDIGSPFFDDSGSLHILSQSTGAIKKLNSVGNTQVICNTNGQPNGACFNEHGILYVADFAHAGILAYPKDGEQEFVVGIYEDKQLKGPNSISITGGDIFFTDSGSLGESGLQSPTGSLFTITNSPSGQLLKPITLSSLAYPAGIAVTPDKKFIYIAEMMTNRVLRYFQQPEGVYHASVFYQLAGGVGPAALALDTNGNLYIGQYDVPESSNSGNVYVVSKTGSLVTTIVTNGPSISGLAIHQKKLYITEKTTASIYTYNIGDIK